MKRPACSAALTRVLDGAERLAGELGRACAGTEHLLLALAQEQLSPAGRILDDQGAQCRLLRCMLLTKQERPEPSGRQGFSTAAAKALDGARHEAGRLGAALCQPEHLLLSLMRDDAYAAARVLLELGVDCNCVFSETYDRLRTLYPAQDVKGQSELKLLELYCDNMIDRAPQMDPVVGREAELSQLMQVLSRRSIREKLLCYFGLLAGQRQRQSFQLPFSLSALADYISADRSAMMRELKKMKDERLVEVAGRQVTLCGPTQ